MLALGILDERQVLALPRPLMAQWEAFAAVRMDRKNNLDPGAVLRSWFDTN